MAQSEQINELAAALAKAQAEIRGAEKGGVNPFVKSRYSTLSDVWDACREALTTNGLAVAQTMVHGNGTPGITMRTVLMHTSGQWLDGHLTMQPVKPDPQGIGSCITYARRYALAAMVGVAPSDDDDDGNAASGRQAFKPDQAQGAPPPKPPTNRASLARKAVKAQAKAQALTPPMPCPEWALKSCDSILNIFQEQDQNKFKFWTIDHCWQWFVDRCAKAERLPDGDALEAVLIEVIQRADEKRAN